MGEPTQATALGNCGRNLISYIQTYYPSRGGVQNNSLGRPGGVAQHPVWTQTALAAQLPPLNLVRVFVGLQVGQPDGFYMGDASFADFESDDQIAVDRAKQMAQNFRPVDFIEFYDVDITGTNEVDKTPSAINDAPDGITSGGYMYVPLADAHESLPGTGDR